MNPENTHLNDAVGNELSPEKMSLDDSFVGNFSFSEEQGKFGIRKEFVLAITGHRDISEPDKVAQHLQIAFAKIREGNPKRRIVLLTAFAEGSDTIAYNAFQAWKDDQKSVRVVLPMPEEDYKKTFSDEASINEFNSIYKEVKSRKFLNKKYHIKHNSHNTSDEKKLRQEYEDQCFSSLIEHYNHNADGVIALWDGVWIGKKGGTSDVVHNLSRKNKDAARCKHIWWLSVQRKSNPHPANELFTWTTIPLSQENRISNPLFGIDISIIKKLKSIFVVVFLFLTVIFGILAHWKSLEENNDHFTRLWDATRISITHLVLENIEPPDSKKDISIHPPQAKPATLSGEEKQGKMADFELHLFFHRLSQTFAILFAFLGVGIVLDKIFHFVAYLKRAWIVRKPHDLVIGLGYNGLALLASKESSALPLIAVEKDPLVDAVATCERLGVCLVSGNAADPSVIKKVGLSKVEKIFVSLGDDETNIRVTCQIAQQLKNKAGNKRKVCVVGLMLQESAQILQNCLPEGHCLDVRSYNSEELTASLLLRDNHIDRFSASPDATAACVILIGDGAMADAILRQVLQQGIFEQGKRLEVIRIVAGAKERCQKFSEQFPCFTFLDHGEAWIAKPAYIWERDGTLPKIHFYEISQNHRGLLRWFEKILQDKNLVTTVIVAFSDAAKSADIASVIAPVLEQNRKPKEEGDKGKDIALWLYFQTQDESLRHIIESRLNANSMELPVRVFTDFNGRCTRYSVADEDLEGMARRINGVYFEDPKKEPKKWSLSNDAELEGKWFTCSENDKNSCRQAANHVWVKLRARKRLLNLPNSKKEVLKKLAICEHRRWCAEYLLKGFEQLKPDESNIRKWFNAEKCYAKKYKKNSKELKYHMDLVPYRDLITLFGEDIGQREQTKDIHQVNSLDRILNPMKGHLFVHNFHEEPPNPTSAP